MKNVSSYAFKMVQWKEKNRSDSLQWNSKRFSENNRKQCYIQLLSSCVFHKDPPTPSVSLDGPHSLNG